MRYDMSCVEQPDWEPPEPPKVARGRIMTARKPHHCDACTMGDDGEHGGIMPGEKYEQVIIIDEDGFRITRLCMPQEGRAPCPRDLDEKRLAPKRAEPLKEGEVPF